MGGDAFAVAKSRTAYLQRENCEGLRASTRSVDTSAHANARARADASACLAGGEKTCPKKEREERARKQREQRRGQLTIVGLFMTFIALVVFIALYPILADVISNSGIGGLPRFLLDLFPLFFVIGILMSFIIYVYPSRATQQE